MKQQTWSSFVAGLSLKLNPELIQYLKGRQLYVNRPGDRGSGALMCCLFGLIDYGNSLSGKTKSKMLNILAMECEARGTDATGIAYVSGGRMHIYKRPLPAHKIHFSRLLYWMGITVCISLREIIHCVFITIRVWISTSMPL